MAAPFESLRGDAVPSARDTLDELLTALISVITPKSAGDDDLQVWEARAREAAPFRDPVQDVSGIQVYRERPASAFCSTVDGDRTVDILARPGNEDSALR